MIYFTTRTAARKFADASNVKRKVVDLGSDAAVNRRWAIRVVNK